MKELIIWVVHTPAGVISVIAAFVALCSAKGSARHRISGKYFTIAMLIMLFSGTIAAFLKKSPDDIFLGTTMIYAMFTAWLTTHHKNGETNFLEYIALIWIVSIGMIAYFADPSWGEVHHLSSYSLWVFLAIYFTIGDVRNLLQKGLSGSQRLIRHIWRMGFALVWAVLAFVDKIIKFQGSTIEEMLYIVVLPVGLVLLIILYWIFSVLFSLRKELLRYS